MPNHDLNGLLRAANRCGAQVERLGNGHYRVTYHNRSAVLASTPSTPSSLARDQRKLEKLGISLNNNKEHKAQHKPAQQHVAPKTELTERLLRILGLRRGEWMDTPTLAQLSGIPQEQVYDLLVAGQSTNPFVQAKGSLWQYASNGTKGTTQDSTLRSGDSADATALEHAATVRTTTPAPISHRSHTTEQNARATAAFLTAHGRLPSIRSAEAEERRLSSWLKEQRRAARRGRLSQDRLTVLNAILPGWERTAMSHIDRETTAINNAKALANFFSANLRFPNQHSADAEERHLGNWLKERRRDARSGIIASSCKAALDHLLPGWDKTGKPTFEEQVEATRVFFDQYGKWPSSESPDATERTLGQWRLAQRYNKKNGRLAPHRKVFLDKKLPGWDADYTKTPVGGPTDVDSTNNQKEVAVKNIKSTANNKDNGSIGQQPYAAPSPTTSSATYNKMKDAPWYIERVLVTPELARQWLAVPGPQRNHNQKMSDAIATDMRNDTWQGTPEPIMISTDGSVEDGMHRLYGVVKSGTSQWFNVVYNVPPELIHWIGTGRTRSTGDVLHIEGVPNSNQLAAGARVLANYINKPDTRTWGSDVNMTNSALAAFAQKHKQMGQYVPTARQMNRSLGIPTSVALACLYITSYEIPVDDQMGTWIEPLTEGVNLKKGTPVYAFRRRWETSRNHVNRTINRERSFRNLWPHVALYLHAWELWRDDKPAQRILVPDTMPRLGPWWAEDKTAPQRRGGAKVGKRSSDNNGGGTDEKVNLLTDIPKLIANLTNEEQKTILELIEGVGKEKGA